MLRSSSLRTTLCAAALALGALGCPGKPPPVDVSADLARYYEDGERPPPWQAAVEDLASPDTATRDHAAAYLSALLADAQRDERSGAAPWRATPFWGNGRQNPAVVLRTEIITALASDPPPAALDVLRWTLDEEHLLPLQDTAARALGQIDNDEASALRRALALRPHPNAVVLREVIEQITARRGRLPTGALASLCQHHREPIREAARALWLQQGGAALPPFDPIRAIASPPLRGLFDEIEALTIEAPPPEAPFVEVTATLFEAGAERWQIVSRGWLLDGPREGSEETTILTAHGRRESYGQPPGVCPSPSGMSLCAAIETIDIADEVAWVEEVRQQGDPDFALSERGGLTGQFQGHGAGLYEVLLAQWLHTSGHDDLAVRILLPALQTLHRDEDWGLLARQMLGQIYGQRMLSVFVGERDYPQTMRLAERLRADFPDTLFHGYAERLARELPLRQDDFGTLALPTPEQWAEIAPTMSRAEQIGYLADRIRLVNCFQQDQPGGLSFSCAQYREPSKGSRGAAWEDGRKTEVINPLVALAGPIDVWVDGEPASKGLDLQVSDIALLAPYLRDDWSLLAVSFWRDFHPDRELHGSRELFAMIIDRIAKKDLSKLRQLDAMSEDEREAHIRGIIRWAEENAGSSEADLLLRALEEGVAGGVGWYPLAATAWALVERGETRAMPILLRLLEAPNTDDRDRESILWACRALDPVAARPTAAAYLTHEAQRVRFQAAMILFRAGEQDVARDEMGKILESGDGFSLNEKGMLEAVDLLLDEGTTASQRAALRVFANPALPEMDPSVRAGLVRRFAAAGRPDGYRFYAALLEIEDHQLGRTNFSRPTAEHFADEITYWLAGGDPEIAAIEARYPTTAERLPAIKAWIGDKIAHPRPPEERP